MSADEGPIVGIDLGTTNSTVAVFRAGAVEVFESGLGDPLTPSVVAMDKRGGALLVGRTAKDIYAAHPELGAAAFKRGMGSDLSYSIAGAKYSSVELSSMVLKQLKQDAARTLGREASRCVITVPAYFNEAQRFATRKAGEMAGWVVERILNEPTAAAIAHGVHGKGPDGTIVVVDLGGGTFDVCVMDRFEGALMVRSVAGESMLGGEDFTRRLASLALTRAGATYETAEMNDPEGITLLLKRAELAKRKLSEAESVEIVVPPVRRQLDQPVPVTVSREDAEDAFAPLLDRLRGPCRAAMRGAGLNKTDITEVILVGGATRMPCIQRFVRERFDRAPQEGVDPDLAIVHGAAIQAALIADDEGVGDMVVTDVASHSLGTSVVKHYGHKKVDGFFLPIIHRNSVIPTSQSQILSTVEPNQTQMRIDVYEGEARLASHNRKIGELIVKDIPRGAPGQQVEVTFTYDLDGILEVECRIVDTGKTVSKILSRTSTSLSDTEIQAAAKRLAKIKQDPRETPAVRDLIARAELLMREVVSDQRERLEAMLDVLEDALARRDPEAVERAVRDLERFVSFLDDGERW
ncbi:MAG: Hsp70 family protein [Planctomycetota bacterium]|nr:Hsp70 family protein [Planctomycetota bacterium]